MDDESATPRADGNTPTEQPPGDGGDEVTTGDEAPSSDAIALAGIGVILGGLFLVFVLGVVQ